MKPFSIVLYCFCAATIVSACQRSPKRQGPAQECPDLDFSAMPAGTCANLNGTWRNEFGSILEMNQFEDGVLLGNVKMTAKELGSKHSDSDNLKLHGVSVFNQPQAVVGFNVIANDGSVLKSWTGQCLVCDGKEMLKTSWMLRKSVDDWSGTLESTNIGQSVFARATPGTGQTPTRTMGIVSNERSPCSLNGAWYNQLGSDMNLAVYNNNTMIGSYFTAVERSQGAAGSGSSKIYGLTIPGKSSSTMAMNVVWRNGGSLTAWVGQCYVCPQTGNETLFTSWLLRTKIDKCADDWKAVYYGQDVFTRFPQKPVATPTRTKD